MRNRIRVVSIAVAAIAVTATIVTTPLASAANPPNIPTAAAAQAMLNSITVAGDRPMTGYSREKFPHWDTISGACSSRELVLLRDGQNVTVGADCYPTAGSWYSEYDGITVTAPSNVDVDHMVPLAEAWRSGADSWTTEQRRSFANDVTRPQLIAVSASSNRSKGDRDPAQWVPPVTSYRCNYVKMWIASKSHWNLTSDPAEKTALQSQLNGCP